jgi:predicted DNA repair protein MutK
MMWRASRQGRRKGGGCRHRRYRVTPGYVIGFEPKRERPIVGKIAAGSLRNKLLILLPAAPGAELLPAPG